MATRTALTRPAIRSEIVPQVVSGLLGLIDFHGSKIPIGYIISFKKSGHNHCNGQGFALLNKIAHACTCAWSRAEREMRKVGRAAFESASIKYASELQEKMYQEALRETARERALSQIPVSTERHVQSDFEVGVIPEPSHPAMIAVRPPLDLPEVHLSPEPLELLMADPEPDEMIRDLHRQQLKEG